MLLQQAPTIVLAILVEMEVHVLVLVGHTSVNVPMATMEEVVRTVSHLIQCYNSGVHIVLHIRKIYTHF